MASILDAAAAEMAIPGGAGSHNHPEPSTRRNRKTRHRRIKGGGLRKLFWLVMWAAAVVTSMRYGATIAIAFRDSGAF